MCMQNIYTLHCPLHFNSKNLKHTHAHTHSLFSSLEIKSNLLGPTLLPSLRRTSCLSLCSVTLALLAPQACFYDVVHFRQFCHLPHDAPPHSLSFRANVNLLEKPPVSRFSLISVLFLCSISYLWFCLLSPSMKRGTGPALFPNPVPAHGTESEIWTVPKTLCGTKVGPLCLSFSICKVSTTFVAGLLWSRCWEVSPPLVPKINK